MTPQRLSELDRRRRQLAVLRAALAVAVAWILLVGAYYVVPIGARSGASALMRLFSTAGFGDLTPGTDLARIMVSVQMLLDLVIIGVAVRLLLNAARVGLARTEQDSPDQP